MTQAPAKKPRVTKADTIRADLAALKEATRRLEALRKEMAGEIRAALEGFESAGLLQEVTRRIAAGNLQTGDAEFDAMLSAAPLSKEQIREAAKEADCTAHDVWPGDYIEADAIGDPEHMGPLIRAAAAVAFDFDMRAVSDLAHLLRRMDVYSARCTAHSQPRLMFNPGSPHT